MRRTRWWVLAPLVGLLPAALAACATIMHGTTQEVSVASSPTGAKVTVDGKEVGQTPVVADLKRKDQHTIRLDLDGYNPYELRMSRGTSGWVWGNIVFGGVIGLAVDAITGGMYKLKPEDINATLSPGTASVDRQGDLLVVTVVLRADPAWERVGTLERE